MPAYSSPMTFRASLCPRCRSGLYVKSKSTFSMNTLCTVPKSPSPENAQPRPFTKPLPSKSRDRRACLPIDDISVAIFKNLSVH